MSDASPSAQPIRVIGTAGHVDHGKSTLITALTGVNPDRLREEQERGMTIDLGFAWLRLPGGADVGIVDVPGHRDFIRNMLAGIGTIDAVLFVVAADEGVMPQTREHLAILELLGIGRGLVVVTKRDLVDDEWAALARADIAQALRGTGLANAPVVEVSATTRQGLDQLLATLESVLGAAPPRRDLDRPRLAVDRSFTMPGFGTVVTGTLLDGSFAVGDEVAIVPGDLRGRVRGLQTHRRSIEVAQPGTRVAMNLSGIEKEAVERGMVVVRPATLVPTSLVAARLEVLPSASVALEHDETVKVHIGTAEIMGRVLVLEGDRIEPGASAWVQLRLASPAALVLGDRLVVRRPTPSETIGGGAIADVAPERAKKRASAVADLERRTAPSGAARLIASLDVPRTAAEAAELSGLDAAQRDAAIAEARIASQIVDLGDALLARGAYETLATRVERMCAQAHRRSPLRAGVPREEVRSALGLPTKRFSALVSLLVADGRMAERGSALALPGHLPQLSPEQESRWTRARDALAREPSQQLSPKDLESIHGIDREIASALAERGDLIRVGDEAVFLPEVVARFAGLVVDEIARNGPITVARARDVSGSSRKHALPLLALMDTYGITRRQGDDRMLIVTPEAARERLASAIRPPRGSQ